MPDRAGSHRAADAAVPCVRRIGSRSRRARLLGLVVLVVACSPATAAAAAWRLTGPDRPAAGESATYAVRGPLASLPFQVHVLAGARACPRDAPPGEGLTSSNDGFLSSDRGLSAQTLSFARGRSTICVHDHRQTVVARKVVRTARGRDRLRISAVRQTHVPTDTVLVTATGYVGRTADPDVTPGPEQYTGTIVAAALPRGRPCPRRAPDEHAPHTAASTIYDKARFTEQLTVYGAFSAAPRPKLCGYLTATRRVFSDLQTRTVAHASTRFHADSTSRAAGSGDNDGQLGLIFGGILAWILVALAVAGISAAIRSFIRLAHRGTTPAPAPSAPATSSTGTTPDAPATSVQPPMPPVEPSQQPPAAPAAAATANPIARPVDEGARRRRSAVPYVIQQAVDATADTYRERLRVILERQDGPYWLGALNDRRHHSMIDAGKPPPRPYRSFEARAVLNCLGWDPAGLQIISAAAAAKARQLSGLAVAAHHPDPEAPLAEADGYRAWQLYTEITGHRPAVDPFER